MHRRLATARVRTLLRDNPAVALVGARQCGKTTLARALAHTYYDLELASERLRLDLEWEAVLASRKVVIFDEAQANPELFPRLRSAIDRDRKRLGRFLLLGSVSPALMRHVSESLAGRLAISELTPFLLLERPATALERLWLCGGFPDGGILKTSRFPSWQLQYVALLTQRDLPAWGLPARPAVTERFMRLVAAAHGSIWNASEIGRGLGMTYHTVNTYLDYLEGTFLVRRLNPYSGSLRKRLIRSPKVYVRDAGLLHALLGIGSRAELLTRPMVGLSWEGFAIEQILGSLATIGRRCEATFLRTSDGQEIDLVLDVGGLRYAIEIKLTSAPGLPDLERLRRVADLVRADHAVLLSRTPTPAGRDGALSTNLPGLLARLHRK